MLVWWWLRKTVDNFRIDTGLDPVPHTNNSLLKRNSETHRWEQGSISMMAYVLINTKLGVIDEVLGLVKKIDNITEAHAVHGLYDIVAKIEAETIERLKNTVTWKIKQLYGIRSAFILIANENINSSKNFYFVPA